MEDKMLKLFTTLGLLCVLVYIIASFVVARDSKTADKRKPRHRHSKGDRWANSIVQGEKCEPGPVAAAPLAPLYGV